jgi:CheY-like chemotaxis protein
MNSQREAILLVDDDADVAWGVGRCLARAGFSVTTCGDGAEAITILESRSFDFLLTDIRMPEVSGLALTDWIRKNRPQTRVIVMTAFGSPGVRQLSLSKGAIQYLEKPVDPNLLVEILYSSEQKDTFTGIIDQIDLLDYLQLMMLSGRQSIVEVVSRDGERGLLFVDSGSVHHASCCGLTGDDAFYRCMNFEGGSFANLPWQEPDQYTINKPGEFLLVEAARKRDEKRGDFTRDVD